MYIVRDFVWPARAIMVSRKRSRPRLRAYALGKEDTLTRCELCVQTPRGFAILTISMEAENYAL